MQEANTRLVAACVLTLGRVSALPSLGGAENAGQDFEHGQVAPHALRHPVPWSVTFKLSDPGGSSSCL